MMKKLIEMPNEEFDKYMCKKYPKLFQDRNKPMSETCMCWGFSVGKGWHELLDKLCEKIDSLEELTGVSIKVTQVKEKYGSLCFYTSPVLSKIKVNKNIANIICEIMEDCGDSAENKSDKICAECGDYYLEKIHLRHWVYDICEECFLKAFPQDKKLLQEWKEHSDFKEYISDIVEYRWHRKEAITKNVKKIIDKLFEEFKKEKIKENK